jgi:hypothetical protein
VTETNGVRTDTRNEYVYYWVWVSVLAAAYLPFSIPSLLYPFIFFDLPIAHQIYYYGVLFATSGPFLLFFLPIALMLAAYFEGLTSGIWIDPNN